MSVMSSNFLCALLCWSGNPNMKSYQAKKERKEAKLNSGRPLRRWWGEWRVRRGGGDVCRSTRPSKRGGGAAVFITSPWTEPRWRDLTAPRWSASPGRRSPPACRPARWLHTHRAESAASAWHHQRRAQPTCTSLIPTPLTFIIGFKCL